MLERLAKKNDLLLSTNLIDFADDVWLEATKAERKEWVFADDAWSQATKAEWTAEKFEPTVD
jgi:hypothetical protein